MNIQTISSNSPSSPPVAARETQSPRNERATEALSAKAPASVVQQKKASDPTDVRQAVERVSEFVAQTGAEISFSVDEASGLNVVKVIDKASKEVIRQIPSEEMVAIAAALDKLQGLFVRDKV
ncbi:MAG: flagellar protein FlaG [Rhodocyclaceae bacterium]|nr:flagellar protein FlaG [Rhodocyclaceae bacterium]